MKKNTTWFLIAITLFFSTSSSLAMNQAAKISNSWTPAMVGGPIARGKNLLSLRYMADANVEVTYNNQVILLSAFYDKGPDGLNFVDIEKVTKADAIFIGHAHFDHMQDAARISKQTGATVYGHKTVTNTVAAQGLPEEQIVDVLDGDIFYFEGFTVEAIHISHSGQGDLVMTPPEIDTAYKNLNNAIKADLNSPKSAEQLAWEERPDKGYGSFAREVSEQGVYAYLFTFGKDFRFIYYDSANATLTREIQNAMARIDGKTDIATLAYAGGPEGYAVKYDMPEIKLFNPRYFFPSHGYPTHLMDPSPLFQAIRNDLPATTPIFLMPKQALVFNVRTHKLIADGILVGRQAI